MDGQKIIELDKEYVIQCYKRMPFVPVRGKSCNLFDSEGKKYLDLAGGIGTCTVGYSNKEIKKAASKCFGKIINESNLFYSVPRTKLAKKLSRLSGLGKTFFSNSGTEANEAAIKIARKVTGRKEIIACKNGFHGRTLGALSATFNEKYKIFCKPLLPGFKHVEYANIGSLKKAISRKTAAVIVEPIQGEAGVVVPFDGYLLELEELCRANGVLLIMDEVQTGCGRTGKFFAFQHEKILPDIVTAAKGLANGIPIGATICGNGIDLDFGDHGSTFGGNSLSCTAALATIKFIKEKNLCKKSEKTGKFLAEGILKENPERIFGLRGKGLMIGISSAEKAENIARVCLENGVLVNNCKEKIIRLLPPLVLKKSEAADAIKKMVF